MIRVMIADDHPLIRHGIRKILSLDENIKVVSEACTGWEVIERLSTSPCDVLLLDIRMPGPSGIELIKRLRRDLPSVSILALSMHTEGEIVTRAIRAGASGYLTKDSDPENILLAINKIVRGGNYIDPSVAEKMLFKPVQVEGEDLHKLLSDREYRVLELLVNGQCNKDVAAAMNISIKTVSTYKTRMMKKIGVDSSMELLRYAMKSGICNS